MRPRAAPAEPREKECNSESRRRPSQSATAYPHRFYSLWEREKQRPAGFPALTAPDPGGRGGEEARTWGRHSKLGYRERSSRASFGSRIQHGSPKLSRRLPAPGSSAAACPGSPHMEPPPPQSCPPLPPGAGPATPALEGEAASRSGRGPSSGSHTLSESLQQALLGPQPGSGSAEAEPGGQAQRRSRPTPRHVGD